MIRISLAFAGTAVVFRAFRTFRPLDSLRTFRPFYALDPLRAFNPFRPFHALGTFCALGAASRGCPIFAATCLVILAPIFTPVRLAICLSIFPAIGATVLSTIFLAYMVMVLNFLFHFRTMFVFDSIASLRESDQDPLFLCVEVLRFLLDSGVKCVMACVHPGAVCVVEEMPGFHALAIGYDPLQRCLQIFAA